MACDTSNDEDFLQRIRDAIPEGQVMLFEDIFPHGNRDRIQWALDELTARRELVQVGFGWRRVGPKLLLSEENPSSDVPLLSPDDLDPRDRRILGLIASASPVYVSASTLFLQVALEPDEVTQSLSRLGGIGLIMKHPEFPTWTTTEAGKAFAREICGGTIDEDEEEPEDDGDLIKDDGVVPLGLALYLTRQIDEAFRLLEREVLINLLRNGTDNLARSYLDCEARRVMINTLTGTGDTLRIHAGEVEEEEEDACDDCG